MGLFVLFFGTKKKYTEVKHHTILFGKEYKKLLAKIFDGKSLPKDLSIYLHRPTATDLTFAPKNCDSYYALVPVPNLNAKIDWERDAEFFKKLIKFFIFKYLYKIFDKNKSEMFKSRFAGLLNSMIGNKSFYRPKLED